MLLMQQNGPRRSLAATLSERRRKEGRKEERTRPAPRPPRAAPSPPIACLSSRLAFCSEVAIGARQRGWKSRRSLPQYRELTVRRMFYSSVPYEKSCGSRFRLRVRLLATKRDSPNQVCFCSNSLVYICTREREGGFRI